jgi:hypothetical protein
VKARYFTLEAIERAFEHLSSLIKTAIPDELDAPNRLADEVMSAPEIVYSELSSFFANRKGRRGLPGVETAFIPTPDGERAYSLKTILHFGYWLSCQLAHDLLPYNAEHLLWDVRRVRLLFQGWFQEDGHLQKSPYLPHVVVASCEEEAVHMEPKLVN